MARYSKIFFVFIILVLSLWLIPWFYHFMTAQPIRNPFTLYSCIIDDFACLDYSENKGVQYKDRNGHLYSDRQFDSILPFFYYHQLASDGRLPDSLNGIKLTPQKIGLTNFIFRQSASDINKTVPRLYPLLEAMSGRVDLQMPGDVFRLNNRIEFIDMATNTILEKKSEIFTQAMKKKDFRFPVRCIGGNPTVKKEYDEGYFLTDSDHRLFHLKQLRGRPYFRPIPLPKGIEITHIFVKEYPNRKFYALLTDQENNLWALSNPDYQLYPLPIGKYDPRQDDIQIIGDLFNWTVSIDKKDGEHIFALDATDYSLIDSLTYPQQSSMASKIGHYFFPAELSFTSYDDQYDYPRLGNYSVKALWVPTLLILLFLGKYYKKKTVH